MSGLPAGWRRSVGRPRTVSLSSVFPWRTGDRDPAPPRAPPPVSFSASPRARGPVGRLRPESRSGLFCAGLPARLAPARHHTVSVGLATDVCRAGWVRGRGRAGPAVSFSASACPKGPAPSPRRSFRSADCRAEFNNEGDR